MSQAVASPKRPSSVRARSNESSTKPPSSSSRPRDLPMLRTDDGGQGDADGDALASADVRISSASTHGELPELPSLMSNKSLGNSSRMGSSLLTAGEPYRRKPSSLASTSSLGLSRDPRNLSLSQSSLAIPGTSQRASKALSPRTKPARQPAPPNRLIPVEDQSISQILDNTLSDVLHLFDFIDAPGESSGGNSIAAMIQDSSAKIGSRTGSKVIISAIDGASSDGMNASGNILASRTLRHRLSSALETLDSCNIAADGTKVDVMGHILDDETDQLKTRDTADLTADDATHLSRLGIIVSERNAKLGTLKQTRDEIFQSLRRAEEEEHERTLEALKGFEAKYQTTVLPPMNILLKLNNETLERAGLIAFSTEDEVEDDEQINLKRHLKNQELLQRIRKYSFPRTDTSLKRFLFAPQKNRVLEIDAAGVLEVEHESMEQEGESGGLKAGLASGIPATATAATASTVHASKGRLLPAQRQCVEPEADREDHAGRDVRAGTDNLAKAPVHTRKPHKVVYGDEEIKILGRMNNRIYFLRNPRFPVTEHSIVALPPNATLNVSNRTPGTSFTDQSTFTMGRSISAAPPTPRVVPATGGIVAEPSTVHFSDYVPYETYSRTLTIRNTTSVAHRFRVSTGPPYKYSQFFTCELTHCPLDNDGLVAPGLACDYTISFTPNSYADFEQTLHISTETGHAFTVHIIAKREPPVLTLPAILDCGPCRAGFVTVRTWDFFNKGGPGRFLIMNPGETLDPFAVFDKIGPHRHAVPGTIRAGQFEIFPSYFALGSNEIARITVRYAPADVDDGMVSASLSSRDSFLGTGAVGGGSAGSGGSAITGASTISMTIPLSASSCGLTSVPSGLPVSSAGSGSATGSSAISEVVRPDGSRVDSAFLRIACDNCQILQLPVSGTAERPHVKILRMNTASESLFHSSLRRDERFHLIQDFGDQNPHGVTSCVIVVRNQTHLRLSFRWSQSDNPCSAICISPAAAAAIAEEARCAAALQHNTSFQITPSKGWLEPNSDTSFTIDFCPETERAFDVIAEMLLLEDTGVKPDHRSSFGLLGTAGEERLLTLRLMGRGVPYAADLSTYILHVPRVLYSGESYTGRLRITNSSVWKLAFEWMLENIDERAVDVEISQPSGIIGPNTCAFITVRITGGFPCRVNGALVCTTANGLGPTLRIPMLVEVGLPLRSIAFDVDVIDFGLLALSEKKSLQIPLVNSSRMTMAYELNALKRADKESPVDSYLIYKPSSGVLAPGATQMVDLTYIPTWYQRLNGSLECLVHAMWLPGPPNTPPPDMDAIRMPPVVASAIEMVSLVQTPLIKVTNPTTSLSCFCNVPVKVNFTLTNLTMLPARFKLHSVKTDDYRACFSPDHGELIGGASVDVDVEIIVVSVGASQLLELYGQVEGMVENAGQLRVSIEAQVMPLEVSFRVIENEKALAAHAVTKSAHPLGKHTQRSAYLRFDFGTRCPIFATRARILKIRNHSAMVSPFKIWFEKYTPTAQVDTMLDEQDADEGIGGAGGGGGASGEGSASDPADHGVLTGHDHHLDRHGHGHGHGDAAHGSAAKVVSSTPQLLQKTKANKIGFSSKAGQGYIDSIKKVRHMIQRMQNLLADGRGAAFHATPSQGVIQPWGEIEVRVTSYNNLVGLYEDFLVCEVGDWVKQRMPVRLGVVGTPVKFSGPQLVAKKSKDANEIDRVNFGARVINPRWGGSDGVRVGQGQHRPAARLGPGTSFHADHSAVSGMGSAVATVSNLSTGPVRPGGLPHSSDPSMPEAFHKSILVENQSPRDVVLEWKVYIRHSSAHERSVEDISQSYVDDFVAEDKRVAEGQMGIIEVWPSTLTIPAFKSAPLTCMYRSALLGSFDALVMADVGYIESDGSVRYAPRSKASKPSKHSGSHDAAASAGSKPGPNEHSNSIGAVQVMHLDSVAKLHIQAKCIEPHLSLDGGNRVRIKQTIRPYSMESDQSVNLGRSVVAFLKNNSDAVCAFTLEALPTRLFSVSGSSRYLKKEDPSETRKARKDGSMTGQPVFGSGQGRNRRRAGEDLLVYELKQTEQLLITVRYYSDSGASERPTTNATQMTVMSGTLDMTDSDGRTDGSHAAGVSLRNTPGYAGSLATDLLATTNFAVSTPSDTTRSALLTPATAQHDVGLDRAFESPRPSTASPAIGGGRMHTARGTVTFEPGLGFSRNGSEAAEPRAGNPNAAGGRRSTMTKAGSLIVAGTQQQQQPQAAAGPLTIPESRGTDRSVGSSPSHGGAALHLASKSVASISPSVSRQPSPPKPGSPGKPPRTPTLVQQRPRAANESADAHAAAQAAQAAAASSDQPASSIALDASSSLADGAAARTARQPSLMPPQHGQGQPQPGSQPGSQPGQPAAARAQQFRTVATGELRITFLNGMMQSIPIVVEQPC